MRFTIPKVCAGILLFSIISCQKELSVKDNVLPSASFLQLGGKKNNKDSSFTMYTILQGHQYCVGNMYPPYATSAMYFTVKFDSSDVYTNQLASNQYDYNKLYGFSDNNSDHHSFSARFGWRWCHNQVELSAYTYNDGIRTIKDLGGVDMSREHNCAILVNGSQYNFVLDGDTTVMARTSKTKKASGYKLLPYFGGDEVAPHNITINIRETK